VFRVFVFSFVKSKNGRLPCHPLTDNRWSGRPDSLEEAGTAPRHGVQATLLASADLTKARAPRLLFKEGCVFSASPS